VFQDRWKADPAEDDLAGAYDIDQRAPWRLDQSGWAALALSKGR
jgi:hypothetical protein